MKVVKAVIIGAIVGLTAGLAAPLLFGAGVTLPFAGIFGIKVALLASMAGSAFFSGLAAIASSFITKPSMDLSIAQGRLNLSIDPQAKGKWIFGETPLATDIIYAEHHGDNNQFASQIIAGAAHLIDSFGDLYVNDELVSFSGNAATGDWAGVLWRQTKIGTESQTAFTDIDAEDDFSWPATADGLGMAHYRLRWKIGESKISTGIPSRITQVAKGAPVYDPRLDTTVGGSGAHRANDQTTWEYTNGGTDIGANWALIVLYYLLGWKNNGKLVFGMGIDPANINFTQAISAANKCADTIDSKPRFRIGGIIETSNDHPAVIKQLEAAIGGLVSQIGGKYYIWAPDGDLTTFSSITDEDLIREVGIKFLPAGPMEHLFNTGRGRYISPADLYQAVPYPDVIESSAVSEDGRDRIMDHDLSMVQDVSIAERVVRYLIRRSRFSGTWRFAMGPKGLLFQPFTVTTLNIQETNDTNVTVRIVNMDFSVPAIVLIECVEEDSSIYDTSSGLGSPVTQLDPNTFDPATKISVTGLAVANQSVTGDAGTVSDGFKVTWDDPGALVYETQVQFKLDGDTEWSEIPRTHIDFQEAIIVPIETGSLYNIRARHITVVNVVGDWSTPVNKTANTEAVAYDTANISGIPVATVLTDIDNVEALAAIAAAQAKGSVGINVNLWNNNASWKTVPSGDIYFQIRLDKTNNRVYIGWEAGPGISGTSAINFEFEVYGETITGFTNVGLEGADIPTDKGSNVDFDTDTNQYGPNGLAPITWTLTGVGSDRAYFTLSALDDDTELRFKIHTASGGTGATDIGVILGDATFIRSNLENSAPHELFITPTDTSKIDALLLINAPAEADATAGATWNGDIVDQPADGNILNSVLAITSGGALSGGGASGTVTIVGLGYNGSLDATDNTITSSASDPTGGINGSLHYNTTSDSWWAKIAGTWYKVGDETANNIAASIADQGDLAILDTVDWQTLVTGSGKPEDDAQVNSAFLGIKINKSDFTTNQNGDIYLHGFTAGTAADVDGFVWYEGSKITISKGNVRCGVNLEIAGYLALSPNGDDTFDHGGTQDRVAIIWIEKDGTWKYDKDGVPNVFVPHSNETLLIIGFVKLTGGVVERAGVFQDALPYTMATTHRRGNLESGMNDDETSGLGSGLGHGNKKGATKNKVTFGDYVPADSVGTNGDLHRNTSTSSWYTKEDGTWTKASDETALNTALNIVGQGDLATTDEDEVNALNLINAPADAGATSGAVGLIPASVRGPEGSTNIELVMNKDAGGGNNDGEIQVKTGVYLLPDATSRTIGSNKQINTPFEGVANPPDNVFYIIWGDSDASTRFPTLGNMGSAEADGIFPAVYDRTSDTWLAQGNDNTFDTESWTPLVTDFVFAIGYKDSESGGIEWLTQVVAKVLDPNADVTSDSNQPGSWISDGGDLITKDEDEIDQENLTNNVRVFIQSSAPTGRFNAVWIDTSNAAEPIEKHWNGTAWRVGTPDFADMIGVTKPDENADVTGDSPQNTAWITDNELIINDLIIAGANNIITTFLPNVNNNVDKQLDGAYTENIQPLSGHAYFFDDASSVTEVVQWDLPEELEQNVDYVASFSALLVSGTAPTFQFDMNPDTLPEVTMTIDNTTPERYQVLFNSGHADMLTGAKLLRMFRTSGNVEPTAEFYIYDVAFQKGNKSTGFSTRSGEDDGTRNIITKGTSTPPTGGLAGDLYNDTNLKVWWANLPSVGWVAVSDETATHVAASIASQGGLATKSVVTLASGGDIALYVEGTWSPIVSTPGGPYTSSNNGYYTRMGNRIFFSCWGFAASKGSASGAISITGLPVVVSRIGTVPFFAQVLDVVAGYSTIGFIPSGAAQINVYLFDTTSGATPLQASETSIAFNWKCSGSYEI